MAQVENGHENGHEWHRLKMAQVENGHEGHRLKMAQVENGHEWHRGCPDA